MKPISIAAMLAANALIMLSITTSAAAEDAPAAADAPVTSAPTPPAATEPAKTADPAAPAKISAINETVEVTQPELKPPRGWSVVKRGDTIYWCSNTGALGSRVRNTDRQCVTPEGYKEMVWQARRAADDMANSTIPPR